MEFSGFNCIIASCAEKSLTSLNKIKTDWLAKDEEELYTYVRDHFKKYSSLPDVSTIYSTFKKLPSSSSVIEPSDFYLNQLKERYIVESVMSEIPGKIKAFKKSPFDSLTDLRVFLNNIDVAENESTDVRYQDTADKRVERYKERKSSGGISYLSTGITALDDYFYGYNRGDLITIGGRSGLGKTWFISYLALCLDEFLNEVSTVSFGDIMFITNEMPIEELEDRIDCLRFYLPYKKFLQGDLHPKDFERYERDVQKVISSILFIHNVKTVDEVYSKINDYKPAICFLDGSYLLERKMKADSWQKVQYITQGLKSNALQLKIPIVQTTQLTKGSGKKSLDLSTDVQDEFAFGQSYIHDSDVAMSFFQDKNMAFRGEVGIQFAKGRRSDNRNKLIWDMNMESMEFDIVLEDYYEEEEEEPVI